MQPDPLELDPETMRQMGYRVVDYMVERIATLREQPAWRGITRAELEPQLREPPPETPTEFERLLNRLHDDVLAYGVRVDHPRFFAFVPGSPTWPGILGEAIAAAHQSFAGTWLGGAGVAMLELVVLDWFRQWLELPRGASGLLLSGGSVANLTALAAARVVRLGESFDDATIYFSTESHSSIERACRVLGFGRDRLRLIQAVDGRMPPAELRRAIAADVAAGLRPFCVIANAGTTSTGAIDPLDEVATIAGDHGLWYHIDAAYGGFAVLTERGKSWLTGIERADSVTLDPHKWLHQPFEAGCLLVRDEAVLVRAFHIMPDYLQDTVVRGAEVNFGERGIQLTRAARAIKIWLSLQYFGVNAFRTAIDRSLDFTLDAQQYIEASPSLELMSPAQLGIVCFRRTGAGCDRDQLERLNENLLRELISSGSSMMSSTRINGEFALRFCVLNHRTRREDVLDVLQWFEASEI
jgi:glutamate/tyrosine decarboxylase-like PLP-dependent enzyme